ncbi:MAG: FHA domain-containing protein [Myxococcales bacterium]|nr:FHA domain-containing protein [Myxococcales bacterium]
MPPSFASSTDLLDRLLATPERAAFLVGSAVTAPTLPGGPGVPGDAGMLDEIRKLYARREELARFEAAIAGAADPYPAAFGFLLATRGQDVANAVVRRCVLQARRRSAAFPVVPAELPRHQPEVLGEQLERDLAGWHLSPAASLLGKLLAAQPPGARPIVLTTNFDPLLSISVRKAGGEAQTVAFHSDGSFAALDGPGTLIVHLDGDWCRSDTLHTDFQRGQQRPQLAASLARLLDQRTLFVLGYTARDDIFTRTLVELARGATAGFDVCWAFLDDDEARLARDHAQLLARLAPGSERGRVVFYKGVDIHTLLLRREQTMLPHGPHQAPAPSDDDTSPDNGAHLTLDACCVVHVHPVGGQRETLCFTRPRITVGRRGSDILLLDDDQVSRVHGEIVHEGTSLHYRDLGSRNGTWLDDGQQVTRLELAPGTLFRVGQSWITVVQVPPGVRPPPMLVGLYSKTDERFARAVMNHLRGSDAWSAIEFINDSALVSRDAWHSRIHSAIRHASAVLLIVSAEFLASEFMQQREVPLALARAQRDGIRVVPVIAGHCAHHGNPTLAHYTPFNPEGEPLAALGKHQRDQELARLVALLAAARPRP